MTFPGPQFNLPEYIAIVVIGASVLAILVIYLRQRTIQLTWRSWVFILLRVLVLVMGWQILFQILYIITYHGGTLDYIHLIENITNLASYGVTLAVAYFVEKTTIFKVEEEV